MIKQVIMNQLSYHIDAFSQGFFFKNPKNPPPKSTSDAPHWMELVQEKDASNWLSVLPVCHGVEISGGSRVSNATPFGSQLTSDSLIKSQNLERAIPL